MEALAVDVWHAVMAWGAFVQERVVGAHQIEQAAILPNLALDEELGFGPERLEGIRVDLRIDVRIRREVLDVPQVEPLAGEVLDERLRSGIAEHAPDLALER